ncbi:putative ribonuclease H-like domain-containing protein [Tanacetum coccineum]
MTTAGTRALVNTGKGKMDTDLKKSRWVWRPKGNYLDHVSKDSGSFMLNKFETIQRSNIHDHSVVDSVVLNQMTWQQSLSSDKKNYNGGFGCLLEVIPKEVIFLDTLPVVKPLEYTTKDQRFTDVYVADSEDVAYKEGQHQMAEDEQVLHDELEKMVDQEVATNINKLSTGRSSVSTATTPYVSTASTPTGANAEDDSDAFSNDGIFNGAYDDDENVGVVANFNNMDDTINVSPIPTLRIHKDYPKDQILGDPKLFLSQEEPKNISQALQDDRWVEKMQEELLQFKLQKVWILVDLPSGKKAIGTKWVFKNKRDERSIVVKNKTMLVAQGFRTAE